MDNPEALAKFRNLLASIDRNIDGVELLHKSNDAFKVSAPLLNTVHEHCKGISTLFENRLENPAFSLVRPLIETFLRGMWFTYCATEKQISIFLKTDKILNGSKNVTLKDIISQLSNVDKLPAELSTLTKKTINAMHSHTHGGMFKVTRNYDGESVQPIYTKTETSEVISISSNIAFITFSEIIENSNLPNANKERLIEEVRALL